MTPSAAAVLADTLRLLPPHATVPLLRDPDATPVPFTSVGDARWLDEQIRLRGLRWRTDDRRVLATLWWYSASVWFQTPAVASLLAAGEVLSPHPEDVTLHRLPDSRITGATASQVLPGPDPVVSFGTALREALEQVVPLVATAGRMRERPLWAIASDSTAGQFLWAGAAVGDIPRASALAVRVAEVVGFPFPRPRWVDVVPVDDTGAERPDLGEHRFLRRASCCLLLDAPGQAACGTCPGRRPEERRMRMQVSAGSLGGGRR